MSPKNFDVISLDLFNTLVYVDRSSFDLYSHMEKALLEFPRLQQYITDITMDNIITDYYSSVRQKIHDKETEREFRNDEILYEVLKSSTEISSELSTLATEIIQFYFESALPLIHAFPGLIKTLDYLKENEYTLVLTSNHSWAPNGWDVLRKYDIISYFDQVVFSGDLGWRKPSPKVFSAALSGLSYRSKEHVLHVGDEIVADIKGALSFGIKALWVYSSQDESKKEKIKDFDIHNTITNITELPHYL
ncbi:MAG: HAD family hydrolase [Candidatus Heimdallarchaeota archaeon]|nr:MAG: HAD family hydrolase [Candidatus Heimdallarchaeota archaeon]